MSTRDIHLPLRRRRNVGALVRAALDTPRHPALAASVRTRGEALVAASDALADDGTAPKLADVDHATDAVVTALKRQLDDRARSATDAVLPVSRDLAAQRDAARRVLAAVYPDGVDFVHRTFGLEWDALRAVDAALARREVARDVATLGLDAVAAHVRAHIALYGRALGAMDHSASGAAGPSADPWSTACTLYIAAVELAYEAAPTVRDELLAPITGERAGYLAELRDARKRSKRKARGPVPSAPATESA